MKLQHLSTKRAAESLVFQGISDYSQMVNRIVDFGKSLGEPGDDAYNDFVGGAFEVFAEFFCTRFGTDANPLLGIRNIQDTSRNKFQVGYDFTYESLEGDACMLQVKFKGFDGRLSRKDLGTFISIADELDVLKKHRILFTNLDETVEDGVFSLGYNGFKQMRVIGRDIQMRMIERSPNFWADLQRSVELALIPPTEFQELQLMWEHQERMNQSCKSVLENGGNGRVICATGGGKTRVILQNVLDGFDLGFNTVVVVAPTIDLLRQHHAYFEKYGLFHRDGISVIHFRTGDECRDNWANIEQTTDVKKVEQFLTSKTIIFVTYASEFKLFEGLRDRDMKVDLILWDEFHHSVRQDVDQLYHLQSLPSSRNIFYSASVKRGRLISGNDEEIYGPLLCEVKYAELRLLGVLVPKIVVKIIRLADGKKIRGLREAMKRAAADENFNLEVATMEAAGLIAAYNDKKKSGPTNIVTFSKSVPICKELTTNDYVSTHFSGLLKTVHAGVPSRERRTIYDEIASEKFRSDSVLCQFSVVKEGIDINPFNTVVFSRSMDFIGTQQAIGRAVRAHPEDTINLQNGTIQLDNPEGWKKYSATLYVILHDRKNDTFNDFLIDLVSKLQFSGLDVDMLAFEDMVDERHGTGEDSNAWIVPLDKEINMVGADSLKDAVANTLIELQRIADEEEAMAKYARARAQLANKDFKTRMTMILNGSI